MNFLALGEVPKGRHLVRHQLEERLTIPLSQGLFLWCPLDYEGDASMYYRDTVDSGAKSIGFAG